MITMYIYSVSVDILELFVDTSKYVKTQQVAANKVLWDDVTSVVHLARAFMHIVIVPKHFATKDKFKRLNQNENSSVQQQTIIFFLIIIQFVVWYTRLKKYIDVNRPVVHAIFYLTKCRSWRKSLSLAQIWHIYIGQVPGCFYS